MVPALSSQFPSTPGLQLGPLTFPTTSVLGSALSIEITGCSILCLGFMLSPCGGLWPLTFQAEHAIGL